MVMLAAHAVLKWFGRKAVLRNASIEVHEGERVAIMGGNGCGKSTLLQILTGVLEADHARLTLPRTIGFAPEKPDLPEHLRVDEWLEVAASLKNVTIDELPFGVREIGFKVIGSLSLGQRQRVSLATAWLGNPDVLVLDEPTNGLDRESREELLTRIATKTVLVATHERDVAERVATRIVHFT